MKEKLKNVTFLRKTDTILLSSTYTLYLVT